EGLGDLDRLRVASGICDDGCPFRGGIDGGLDGGIVRPGSADGERLGPCRTGSERQEEQEDCGGFGWHGRLLCPGRYPWAPHRALRQIKWGRGAPHWLPGSPPGKGGAAIAAAAAGARHSAAPRSWSYRAGGGLV